MYVNRPVMPTFLQQPQPARVPVPTQPPYGGAPGSIYTNANVGSDPLKNLKVLATNVFTTLVNFAKSFWASVQRAFSQPHA